MAVKQYLGTYIQHVLYHKLSAWIWDDKSCTIYDVCALYRKGGFWISIEGKRSLLLTTGEMENNDVGCY